MVAKSSKTRKPSSKSEKHIACTIIPQLDDNIRLESAYTAIEIFPANAPSFEETKPSRISVLTQKYWGTRAKDLTVGFMEQQSTAFRDKVVAIANMWNEFSYARFRWTQSINDATIRISTGRGGYYSYLGTDCLHIPRNRQTMNLEGFTLNTRESEWLRVVLHEFGHALGCPHEHQRREIIELLDYAKVVAEFRRTQGWSEQEIRQQIFTPLEERSLMGASPADQSSIMCYQFSGRLTKNGQPILGGNTFSPVDKQFFSRIYPKDTTVPVNGDGLTPEKAIQAIRDILTKVKMSGMVTDVDSINMDNEKPSNLPQKEKCIEDTLSTEEV